MSKLNQLKKLNQSIGKSKEPATKKVKNPIVVKKQKRKLLLKYDEEYEGLINKTIVFLLEKGIKIDRTKAILIALKTMDHNHSLIDTANEVLKADRRFKTE
jgi:hypothetical protein